MNQRCQIFLGPKIPKREKYSNGRHKQYQMAEKDSKILQNIYPNWDFWSEKKPSGNPDLNIPFIYRRTNEGELRPGICPYSVGSVHRGCPFSIGSGFAAGTTSKPR
jgi:hypothetical protein